MTEKAMSDERIELLETRGRAWTGWPDSSQMTPQAIRATGRLMRDAFMEIDHLREQARLDWSLLEATYQYLVDMGSCDDATQPDESPYCESSDCSFCAIAKAFQVVYPKRLAARSKP